MDRDLRKIVFVLLYRIRHWPDAVYSDFLYIRTLPGPCRTCRNEASMVAPVPALLRTVVAPAPF